MTMMCGTKRGLADASSGARWPNHPVLNDGDTYLYFREDNTNMIHSPLANTEFCHESPKK